MVSRITSRVHQRAANDIAPRARMTSVHTTPQKAPLGKPKGVVSQVGAFTRTPLRLLPNLSFGTAQRSLNRSRIRASLSSDRPGLPLSVFRRAGATTCVCADAAPNERARTPCRNSSGESQYTPIAKPCQGFCEKNDKMINTRLGKQKRGIDILASLEQLQSASSTARRLGSGEAAPASRLAENFRPSGWRRLRAWDQRSLP